MPEVRGLTEFRKELKKIDEDLPKEMKAALKEAAEYVSERARTNAKLAGGVWAKAWRGITPRVAATSSGIGVNNNPPASARMAPVAFWGAKKRTGWFAAPKYAAYKSQHPAWVGNSWQGSSKSEGPYVINYTMAEEEDKVVDMFGDALDRLASKAFPD